jgi:AcrR family transcriptional regulator
VLAAAMAIADEEGLGAISMRRLGRELGVEAMSLYYHLPGKDGLLDGLAEALIQEIEAAVASRPPESVADWKSDLRSRCLSARRVVLRHRWTPALFASRKSIPPTLYPYVDDVIALFAKAGFSYQVAHRALHALGSMMFGFAQELFSPPSSGGQLDAAKNQAEFAAIAEKLPHLTAMVAAEIHRAGEDSIGWCDSQSEFEFTLDLLIDGLERIRMAARSA